MKILSYTCLYDKGYEWHCPTFACRYRKSLPFTHTGAATESKVFKLTGHQWVLWFVSDGVILAGLRRDRGQQCLRSIDCMMCFRLSFSTTQLLMSQQYVYPVACMNSLLKKNCSIEHREPPCFVIARLLFVIAIVEMLPYITIARPLAQWGVDRAVKKCSTLSVGMKKLHLQWWWLSALCKWNRGK